MRAALAPLGKDKISKWFGHSAPVRSAVGEIRAFARHLDTFSR